MLRSVRQRIGAKLGVHDRALPRLPNLIWRLNEKHRLNGGYSRSMAGTPPGQQRLGRVKTSFPASTFSFRYLNSSFTQGIRMRLLRSATPKAGWAPVLWGQRGAQDWK